MDRFCRNCGESRESSDRFCGRCGMPVREESLAPAHAVAPVSMDAARRRFQEVFAGQDLPDEGGPDDPARRRFRSTFATFDESPEAPVARDDADSSSGGGIVALVLSVAALPLALLLAGVGLVVLMLGGLGGLVAGIAGHSASRPGTSDRGLSDAGAIIGGLEAGFAVLVLISRA